ncbi:MAG: helix-turn-helix domain-containing protein [Isosphaeraceae bacterium]
MSSARKAFVLRESTSTASSARIDLHGEYSELRPFVAEIKRARERARLTLAEMSRRCGIDQPALSRLENGHNEKTRRLTRSGFTLPQSGSAWC